jgi:hypothetical protein
MRQRAASQQPTFWDCALTVLTPAKQVNEVNEVNLVRLQSEI